MKMDISLEHEVREFLRNHKYRFTDNSESPIRPDFEVEFPGSSNLFYLELKEKRRPIRIKNWPMVEIPEGDLVIVDELAARRLMRYAPNSGILFRDNISQRYIFMDVIRLWLMPRRRVNRRVTDDGSLLKGKWLLNTLDGVVTKSMATVFHVIEEYSQGCEKVVENKPCLGRFVGEEVPFGGEVRTRKMKEYDYRATR